MTPDPERDAPATGAARSGTPRLRAEELRSALAGPFSLALAPGECIAVTGPSGAGKSLLLRMVADLDPHDGEAWLDGRPRRAMPAPEWRRRVTCVAAESGWWAETAAAHFAARPGRRRDRRASESTSAASGDGRGPGLDAARALASRLGIGADRMDAPVGQLSTGERQRLALVRAFLPAPPVLLLDEPTGPLDRDSTAQVEALLRERLQAGASVLLVTHDPAQAERLASRRLHMRAGRLREA